MKKSVILSRQAIIVLGMHRSGTSALARTLNLCGVDLGSNLMSPGPEDNVKGFWEHMDIYQMNEKLLQDLGSSWDDVRALPDRWWNSDFADAYKLEIISILERDFSNSPFWGVKDPRICHFLPLWRLILEQTGNKPFFLIIVRNPLEVVASLAKRDGFSRGKSCLLWLKHLIESEKGTRNTSRMFVTYEELLSDWEGLLTRVEKTFGFKWPKNPMKAEIKSFLQDSMRHNKVTDTTLIKDKTLSKWIRDMYLAINGIVDGDDTRLIKTVNTIEAELKEAVSLYDPVLTEIWEKYQANSTILQERSQQLDDINNQVEEFRQDKGHHLSSIDHLQSGIKEKDERIQQLGSELAGLREEFAASQQSVKEHESKVANLETRIKEKYEHIHQIDADAGRLRDEIDSLQTHVVNFRLDREAILNSTSWKITLPFRVISQSLKNLHRRRIMLPFKIIYWLFTFRIVQKISKCRTHKRIIESGLFDEQYYLKHNPDVNQSGMDLLWHYINHGETEGRSPNPLFNPFYYLKQYPDVAESGMNALCHYYLFGVQEGRSPHPQIRKSSNVIQAGNRQNGNQSQRPNGEFADRNFEPLVHPSRVPATTSTGKYSAGLLIVSHDASRSGASIIIHSITKEISKRYNLDIAVLLLKGGELEDSFKECANVYNLSKIMKKYGSRNKAIKAIIRGLKKRNIHTALCNTVVTGEIVRYLKQNGFEIISLIHELMSSIKIYRWTSLAESHSLNSDKLIFSAKTVLNSFEKQFPYKPKRFIIKPQGLQIKNPYLHEKERVREWLRDHYNISKDARIVLGCGYGDLRKGLDIFANVAIKVLSRGTTAKHHFIWVGGCDTVLAGWLNHDMEKMGFHNNFHLAGHQSDPYKFFAGSDLFLLTSREDPFPTVFMEAMDAGLPFIAFKGTGGAEESLSDGSGILVPYLSVEAMAEEVIQLLSNKNEMQRIAVRGAYKVHKDYRISDYVDFILQSFGSIKTVETIRKQNVNSVSASRAL